MTTSVAALALAAALALVLATGHIEGITEQELYRARDRALLGLLAATAITLVWANEVWLGCMAASFVWHWRGTRELPSLVCWIGIGTAWMLATRLAAVAGR